MDWRKVAQNLLTSLRGYLDIGMLSKEAEAEVIELYEQLSETNRLPEVVTTIVELLDIDVADIIAVLAEYLLKTMDELLDEE